MFNGVGFKVSSLVGKVMLFCMCICEVSRCSCFDGSVCVVGCVLLYSVVSFMVIMLGMFCVMVIMFDCCIGWFRLCVLKVKCVCSVVLMVVSIVFSL